MTIEEPIIEKKEVKKQIITLNFDCYEFFKFIDTIKQYVDEMELVFEKHDFTINFMDASRIMICKCSHLVDTFTTIERMVFGINTDDLMKLLRVRKQDQKQVELIFDNTKTFIQIIKTSKKFDSEITKTLETIELDLETVPPMENLNKIEYPSEVNFSTKFLDDFFYESGIYSDIVSIEINKDIGISFKEEGQIGNSEYLIKSDYCNEIKGFGKGSYAYSFLNPIKPLLPILTNSDITFHIKNDNPIKLEIAINALDIDMLVYLAPRVEEADYDDDDEF